MKCRDKIAYPGRQAAEKALNEIKSSPEYEEKDRKQLRAYSCDACDCWHLTSMDAKTFNKILNAKKSKRAIMINREVEYWTRKNNW